MQRFIKFIRDIFGGGQTPSMKDKEMHTVRDLPELTNSDLEFLFTQLLEGVHQARGQHWVSLDVGLCEVRIDRVDVATDEDVFDHSPHDLFVCGDIGERSSGADS